MIKTPQTLKQDTAIQSKEKELKSKLSSKQEDPSQLKQMVETSLEIISIQRTRIDYLEREYDMLMNKYEKILKEKSPNIYEGDSCRIELEKEQFKSKLLEEKLSESLKQICELKNMTAEQNAELLTGQNIKDIVLL
jgi:hypothetical protein